MDHNVQINFPRRGEEAENVITIVGYQENAEAARDSIMKIVKELVSIFVTFILCFFFFFKNTNDKLLCVLCAG